MPERFSTETLARYLFARIDALESTYRFDRCNGYDQVVGKGEQMNRAYGEWRTLLDVAAHMYVMESECASAEEQKP